MTENAVALTPKAGSIVTKMSRDQLKARLAHTRDETGASLNQFLSFNGKNGKFYVKTDGEKIDIDPGTELALNILDAKKGWTCWKEKKPVDNVVVGFFEGSLPPKESLPDHSPYKEDKDNREGWSQYIELPFKNLETGQQYLYKASSESARRSVGKLIDDIVQAGNKGYDFTTDIPVVKLGSKEFEANGFDNVKPTFEIVKWHKNAISTAAIVDGGASADAAAASVQQEAEVPKKGGLMNFLPNSKK